MQKETIFAIFIICLFFFSYLLFGFWLLEKTGKINNSQDFIFHFQKAKGLPVGDYKPLYHFLFYFFSENEFLFYSANLFLVMVLIPFLLFFLCRSFWVVLIYFCGVSFPHFTLFSATYPAALMVFLFLIYLDLRKRFILKKFYICIGFVFIGGLIHSFGAALFLVVLLSEFVSTIWAAFQLKFFLLLFLKSFLTEKTKALLKIPVILLPVHFDFSIRQTNNLFLNLLPLQTIYFAARKIDLFFLIIIIGSAFGMLREMRAIIIPQIICCICASDYIEKKEWKTKRLFLVFLLMQCFFYLILYFGETIKIIILN